ncbi:alpha/beta fold hydrolase [Embleya sp. NBC_00896]|uniref:alpha/beta fold hydrolase n=1 Tax=Embleya sp. NBC_00896 TaxID=2975961 RepID=UPI003866DA2E|nr:alpha/beta hydrolase [Embleya sp. NBC_00896]
MTTISPASDADATPWPARTVEVATDTHIVVRRDAEGDPDLPPAMMIHGLGGSSSNWTELAAELRPDLSVEMVDLPGFGYSPPPRNGDYSISAHCRVVEGVILSMRRGPVHLFGNSMGGGIATRLAARRPDLVRSLTLVSPALPDLRPRPSVLPTALLGVPGVGRALLRLSRNMTPEQRTRMSIAVMYGDPDSIGEKAFTDAANEYRRRLQLPYMMDAFAHSTRAVIGSYVERGEHALWRQAADVRAPTLLVYGRRDKLVDPRMAKRATETFPDARLLVVPDSGHVAMLEHPRVVARGFRELLDGALSPSNVVG